MKLRRDLSVEFDQKQLADMIINGMASMIQEFLGTGEQDLLIRDIGTISSVDTVATHQLEGTYVSFIYTDNIRLATIGASCMTEHDSRRQWFNVIVNIGEEGCPVLAVYEDDRESQEDQVFIDFDLQNLDFIIPSRS